MDSLNFHSLSWDAFDEHRQALNLDTGNTLSLSTTPDFAAMCDLLSEDGDLNLILSEDV
jgi:hypothetical protein